MGKVLCTNGFIERSIAEQPENGYVQIIPYINVFDSRGYIALFERVTGDYRLKGMITVGIGGHIDEDDAVYNQDGSINMNATIFRASLREIMEEIGIVSPKIEDMNYELRSTEKEVDRVHVGLLKRIVVEENELKRAMSGSLSKELSLIGYLPLNEKLLEYELETWSKLSILFYLNKQKDNGSILGRNKGLIL